jgi:hypothetical protein
MPTIASLTRRHKKTPLTRLLHKRRRPPARSVFDAAIEALRGERVTALRSQLREKATQLVRNHRREPDGRD